MVPWLRREGHEVTGLDTGYFQDCDFEPSVLPIREIRKDVRDVTPADLEGFDAVIHLAALSNDPMGEMNETWTREINDLGSIHLAQAAKAAGVGRFLFSSSCSMYGAAGDALLDETAEFRPVSAYARSKIHAEAEIAKLGDASFCPVFLRNATAYGVSPRLRVDLVLNNLTAWACTTGKVRILSDGTPWRPLVHIEDICAAFAAALMAPKHTVHGQAFNVGASRENYRFSQLAEIVQAVVPGCEIEYAENRNRTRATTGSTSARSSARFPNSARPGTLAKEWSNYTKPIGGRGCGWRIFREENILG
jgi:nucleoside-diphosphate-sugar epimerase